jgi:hypothetical protein
VLIRQKLQRRVPKDILEHNGHHQREKRRAKKK